MAQEYVEIDRSHPYLAAIDLDVYEVVPGRWRVKWRDFLSVKQDAEFFSEKEARDFSDYIWESAHMIPKDLLDDACQSYEDASSFWESLL